MVKEEVFSRPVADFPQEIWEKYLTSLFLDDSVYESYAERTYSVKGEVKRRLDDSTDNVIESIKLIDSLCRLGVSYHFKVQIEEKLNQVAHDLESIAAVLNGYDLYTVALVFQALRQHGHKVFSDVFMKFKNKEGKFDETLLSDARGMLSLYEAAHWATHGEEILDEALEFTRAHLPSLASQTSNHLAERIKNSLITPYQKGIHKLEVRQYIAYYEKEDDADPTLLEFAKLDFNFCQMIYRQELENILRWLKETNIKKELPYGRVRPVEIFFWSIGICYEPQYSLARSIFTKMVTLVSYTDDTYDAYATVEELNLFTDAIQMYPNSEIKLPDYLKFFYETIHRFYSEAETELAEEGKSQYVSCAIDTFKALVKAYQQETKWLNCDFVPTVEEYMENGIITSDISILMVAVLMGIREAKVQVLEWFKKKPLILTASETIARLKNDIVSREFEKQRKHPPSVVECYMKQYDVFEKDAVDEVQQWIAKAWKDINEGFLESSSIPFDILNKFLNNARVLEVFYTYYDGYTVPEMLKNNVIQVLFEEIPM